MFKNYFDVVGMILFSIDVVMAPFGLAWEDVGARFSNVVSLISVGHWSHEMILSFVRPYERLSGDQLAVRAALIHIGHAYLKHRVDLHCLSHTGESINAPPVPLQDCAVLENHAIGSRVYEDEWRPLQGVHGCAQAPSSRPRVGGIVQLRGRHRQIFYAFHGDEPYWIVRVVLPRPN